MAEEIDKTPQTLAAHTDLRMLPNRSVVYRVNEREYMFGNLIALYCDPKTQKMKATLVLSSPRIGVGTWQYIDKEYAARHERKDNCWYFENPMEQHKIVMANHGYEMSEEEMKPYWHDLKLLRTEPAEPKLVDPVELVQRVIEKSHAAEPESDDSSSGTTGISHAGKHNKAHAAKAS
jgi:hypothetical protein